MDTPTAVARQIAAEVRTAMTAAGLTQRDIADRTTIPLATLSRRLTGNGRAFSLTELAEVADVLEVSVTELFVRAEHHIGSAA